MVVVFFVCLLFVFGFVSVSVFCYFAYLFVCLWFIGLFVVGILLFVDDVHVATVLITVTVIGYGGGGCGGCGGCGGDDGGGAGGDGGGGAFGGAGGISCTK